MSEPRGPGPGRDVRTLTHPSTCHRCGTELTLLSEEGASGRHAGGTRIAVGQGKCDSGLSVRPEQEGQVVNSGGRDLTGPSQQRKVERTQSIPGPRGFHPKSARLSSVPRFLILRL